MSAARARFFAAMERELEEQQRGEDGPADPPSHHHHRSVPSGFSENSVSTAVSALLLGDSTTPTSRNNHNNNNPPSWNSNNNDALVEEIDFSLTESGRTVAHWTEPNTTGPHHTSTFSLTESGRTVDMNEGEEEAQDTRHTNSNRSGGSSNMSALIGNKNFMMVDSVRSSLEDGMDFSITGSTRPNDNLFSDSDAEDLMETFRSTQDSTKEVPSISNEPGDGNALVTEKVGNATIAAAGRATRSDSLAFESNVVPASLVASRPSQPKEGGVASLVSAARAIPVPQNSASLLQSFNSSTAYDQASSAGSSGSAFLSSVLNPLAGLEGVADGRVPTLSTIRPSSAQSNTAAPPSTVSHSPPTVFGTSYELAHFGKRARAGSVSGRLRSASEYLEEKGLLDRQTKGILKDLIIIGDEELQQALDMYEQNGDASALEDMIRSGELQNRLPKDLDILGDLDLDFLTVHDDALAMGIGGNIEPLPNHHPRRESDADAMSTISNLTRSSAIGRNRGLSFNHMIYEDDGIGEMDFTGDFLTDHNSSTNNAAEALPSEAASPAEASQLTEYERRMRSNSLFSALVNVASQASASHDTEYGQWMDRAPHGPLQNGQPEVKSPAGGGIRIGGKPTPAKSNGTTVPSGLTASLEEAEKKQKVKKNTPKNKSKDEKPAKAKAEKPTETKRGRKKKDPEAGVGSGRKRGRKKEIVPDEDDDDENQDEDSDDKMRVDDEGEDDEEEVHVPGSGRPRSLSDPHLQTTLDEHGLRHVERPEGWIGAYSPESRKVRIERFLAKRPHRVWTKTVKYDVRKTFANSRLRVKGRFVKKEDELMMRELMSLT